MGKSNKFDYSKRGSSAAKLGHIISRDLKKEAERADRDAEKLASKVRKCSTGSSSGCSGPGSGNRDGVPLDMQVPSKDLGDEGTLAMSEGLEFALCQGRLLLEHINLSMNGLTTVSLARLAPIIRLARHDMKTLNLAGNNIRVETAEDAEQWETFLLSFKDCFRLRRLDLSGNVNLGARAFEIMAKVHVNETPIDPLAYRGETSVISLLSEEQLVVGTEACFLSDHMSRGAIIKRRTGLRSIPYITLTNTGLDDLSALWLSFILEEHHYPNQLIDSLNATSASSTIATYQQNARFQGIDWNMENPKQSRDGQNLLQKAENFREQVVLAEDHIFDGADNALLARDADDESIAIQSGDRRISRALLGNRRTSVRSIRTADGGEHELSELESARKRLQRSLMTNHGVSKTELWSAALRLVISSRTLMCIGPQTRDKARIHLGPLKLDFTTHSPLSAPGNKEQSEDPITPKVSFDRSMSTPSRQGTYAATLTTKSKPFLSERDMNVTDVPSSPRTPKILFKTQRKTALINGSETAVQNDSSGVSDRNPQRFVQWQKDRVRKQEAEFRSFRDGNIPSHLPGHLVDLIASFTLSGRERQLLSDEQLQAALSWGRRRANLGTEKEWRRMPDSSQTWTLLEAIGCLAYRRQ